jgi:uncharacterized protein (TIGR02466 family)
MSNLQFQGIQPLFYSPLSIFQVENAADLNSRLLAETTERRENSPGLQRSNIRGWHSEDDFFDRMEPGCRTLRGHILEAIRVCTQNVSPEFDFGQFGVRAEGWINVLEPGGLNAPHDHPGWVWSGSYYIKVPESDLARSGNIEFFDSRTNVRTLTVEGAACFASKYGVEPKSGMLLIFPAYLRHWVYPNESSEERVTVAFNARFAKLNPANLTNSLGLG